MFYLNVWLNLTEGRKENKKKLHFNTALKLSSEVCYTINCFLRNKAGDFDDNNDDDMKTNKTETNCHEEKSNRTRKIERKKFGLISVIARITCKGTGSLKGRREKPTKPRGPSR